MKKLLTLPFLCLFFTAFAQPKIHSITSFADGDGKRKNVQLFDYQENGLVIKQQTWEYQRVDSTPQLIAEILQRFTNKGQLLSEDSQYWRFPQWRYRSKIDNVYDANGCLIERKYTNLDTNKQENRILIISIKNNAKCLPVQETVTKYENFTGKKLELDSSNIIKKFEYDSRDSLIQINYSYFYKGLPNAFIPSGFTSYKRRANGKISEIHSENVCEYCIDLLGYSTRFQIEYNANGQIIMEKTIAQHQRIFTADSIVYSYNAANKLSRFVKFAFDARGKMQSQATANYDYYCDNLLKMRTEQFEYEGIKFDAFKTIYTYTEGSNCEKTATLDFTIAPNPAQWQVTIASDALLLAENTLTIYNSMGAIMENYVLDYRTNSFDFSTLNLSNGTYLLRLTNGKNSVTKKMIVVH